MQSLLRKPQKSGRDWASINPTGISHTSQPQTGGKRWVGLKCQIKKNKPKTPQLSWSAASPPITKISDYTKVNERLDLSPTVNVLLMRSGFHLQFQDLLGCSSCRLESFSDRKKTRKQCILQSFACGLQVFGFPVRAHPNSSDPFKSKFEHHAQFLAIALSTMFP